MSPAEIQAIAERAGMSIRELRNLAMPVVMIADPLSAEFRLAWAIWNDGESLAEAERKAALAADGWQYYPRNENGTPMHCPNGHEANLTGGKHPVWTCRVCDMTEIGYEENGAAGYWLRWQVIH